MSLVHLIRIDPARNKRRFASRPDQRPGIAATNECRT